MEKMVILITGGLGYLGGRIAEHLLKQGCKVRLATSRSNFYLPAKLSPCEVVKINLENSLSLKSACSGVDVVIHLAAMNALSCAKKPKEALLVNGIGSLNIFKSANEQGVSRIIYFSTAHIYGSPLTGEINELTLPKPVHDYSITHRVAEDYLHLIVEEGEIKGTIFRLSNAIGSPISKDVDCWALVTNDLVKQVVATKKMIINSNELIQRDYISISDVCNAVSFTIKNTIDGVFNLGNGRSMSLRQLAFLILSVAEKKLGFKAEIEFLCNDIMKGRLFNLVYSNEKILTTGVRVDSDFENEISELLVNCNRWFS